MSKGDSPRPHDPARYRSEWERIFKKNTGDDLLRMKPIFGMLLGPDGYAAWDLRGDTEPDGVVTDVTLDFSLEMIRRDPARGETDGETGAT